MNERIDDRVLVDDFFDGYKEIGITEALEILKNKKYFNKDSGVLDLSKTDYEAIRVFAFESKKIKKVLLPKSLKVIEFGAFRDNLIKEIDFEKCSDLWLIDESAFSDNKLKKSSVFGLDNVLEIKNYAFDFEVN